MVFPVVLLKLVESVILLYCGILSFRAIQSEALHDDKQWLTFWFVYALFQFSTCVADYSIGFILPFYNEAKIGVVVFLGVFNGATIVYPIFEPFLVKGDLVARKYQTLAEAKVREASPRKTKPTTTKIE
mmetsp:Transcript_6048/g.7492  ORF Transcript_6048/g.7492 Transcript_6048/m.7492 type:complete len:129 (-) Transcript_6048:650-1036(-)|eukprot:CAMPEP_0185747416 /NCGR_PEP_ID=MMETSP1174-20130828/6024_1 /TAXON_ID=35687 /ORGANISM="Dictyocha speculum, Strain CCMP1381" /LENGTH=128 /DNA_ID=CAMNT_0028422571 /DNA_START=43 /DNA_END=429 /DNA_ORIENTATION=-